MPTTVPNFWPIWKDYILSLSDSGDDDAADLTVKVGDETIYAGKVFNIGKEDFRVCVNDICADYMATLRTLTENELEAMDLPLTFKVSLNQGAGHGTSDEVSFINDWSYEPEHDVSDMSAPIDGLADPRMWIPHTSHFGDTVTVELTGKDGTVTKGKVEVGMPQELKGTDMGRAMMASGRGTAMLRLGYPAKTLTVTRKFDFTSPGTLDPPQSPYRKGSTLSSSAQGLGYLDKSGTLQPSTQCLTNTYEGITGSVLWLEDIPVPYTGGAYAAVMAAAYGSSGSLLGTLESPVTSGKYSGVWMLPSGTASVKVTVMNRQVDTTNGIVSSVRTSAPLKDALVSGNVTVQSMGGTAYIKTDSAGKTVLFAGASILPRANGVTVRATQGIIRRIRLTLSEDSSTDIGVSPSNSTLSEDGWYYVDMPFAMLFPWSGDLAIESMEVEVTLAGARTSLLDLWYPELLDPPHPEWNDNDIHEMDGDYTADDVIFRFLEADWNGGDVYFTGLESVTVKVPEGRTISSVFFYTNTTTFDVLSTDIRAGTPALEYGAISGQIPFALWFPLGHEGREMMFMSRGKGMFAASTIIVITDDPDAGDAAAESVEFTDGTTYRDAGDCHRYALYYMNAYGGWDAFLIRGTVTERDSLTRRTIRSPYDSGTSGRGTRNYANEIEKSWTLRTGWLTDGQSGRMHHLLNSTDVWMHDLDSDRLYPVVLTSTETEYRTYRTNGNRMTQYEVEVTLAQDRQRR